jgi:hypothetical protein
VPFGRSDSIQRTSAKKLSKKTTHPNAQAADIMSTSPPSPSMMASIGSTPKESLPPEASPACKRPANSVKQSLLAIVRFHSDIFDRFIEGYSSMGQIFTPVNIVLMVLLTILVGFFIYQQTKKLD